MKNSFVQISDDVIKTIINTAAKEIDEIKLINNYNKNNAFSLLVNSKGKSMPLFVTKNGVVNVYMKITVKYGFNVSESCKKLQEKIKSSIESMSGLKVNKVKIVVTDIVQ